MEIGTLSVKLTVENCEEALVKAMEVNKSKLQNWHDILYSHGYSHQAEDVKEYIDMLEGRV